MEENLKRLAEAVVNRAYILEYARNYSNEYYFCIHCKAEAEECNHIEHDSECPVLLAKQVLSD